MLKAFIIRLGYILYWIVVSPFVLYKACRDKRDTLPEKYYYFDNEEDGFDGNKRNWYNNYLGKNITKDMVRQRWLISCRWSAWRNPPFNLRYKDSTSYNIVSPENINFKGNTYHHEARYSLEPNKKEVKWYKLTATYDGKKATSWFYLIPLWKGKALYLRFGLKLYPANYFDKWWLAKIEKEGWPKYKDKGIIACTFRIRDYI